MYYKKFANLEDTTKDKYWKNGQNTLFLPWKNGQNTLFLS